MDILYNIILVITIVSYLAGLFLTHFEKKNFPQLGNAGFINIFGSSKNQGDSVRCTLQSSHLDEEII